MSLKRYFHASRCESGLGAQLFEKAYGFLKEKVGYKNNIEIRSQLIGNFDWSYILSYFIL